MIYQPTSNIRLSTDVDIDFTVHIDVAQTVQRLWQHTNLVQSTIEHLVTEYVQVYGNKACIERLITNTFYGELQMSTAMFIDPENIAFRVKSIMLYVDGDNPMLRVDCQFVDYGSGPLFKALIDSELPYSINVLSCVAVNIKELSIHTLIHLYTQVFSVNTKDKGEDENGIGKIEEESEGE